MCAKSRGAFIKPSGAGQGAGIYLKATPSKMSGYQCEQFEVLSEDIMRHLDVWTLCIGEKLPLEAEESNQHHNHAADCALFSCFHSPCLELYIIGLVLGTATLSTIALYRSCFARSLFVYKAHGRLLTNF